MNVTRHCWIFLTSISLSPHLSLHPFPLSVWAFQKYVTFIFYLSHIVYLSHSISLILYHSHCIFFIHSHTSILTFNIFQEFYAEGLSENVLSLWEMGIQYLEKAGAKVSVFATMSSCLYSHSHCHTDTLSFSHTHLAQY